MGKIPTYAEVVIFIKNLGYKLLDKEYIKSSKHLTIVDGDGYFYYTPYNQLKQNKIPTKFGIHNPNTIFNVKLWIKLNNKTYVLLSKEFVGCHEKLKFKCLKCDEVFDKSLTQIQTNKGCPYCSGDKVGISNCLATKNPKLASEWHPTKNGDLTPHDVTYGSEKQVWWQCKKNLKHEWITSVNSRTYHNPCCPYCAKFYPSEGYNLLIVNPNVCEEWDYEKNNKMPFEYTPVSGKKVWWKCKVCNNSWYASIDHRARGQNCPECKMSKGEKRTKEHFISNGFTEISMEEYNLKIHKGKYFASQKTYPNLIGTGGGLLSYDFWIPCLNLLIEYQGEQHERPVDFLANIEDAQKRFENQQEHDARKKEYAKSHNINLLEIWYWDFDNIEQILDDYILQIGGESL